MTDQHNTVSRVSADDRVAESIAAIVEVFHRLELDYAMFGSCGIQTYFDYFFRLPNDLDVIIRRDDVPKLRNYCTEEGHEFVEELGRSKMHINGFPVHVIPEFFSSVNKATNTIFARIDLSSFISDSVVKRVHLACASITPKINVVRLEMCLFMDLIRTMNTNSLMTTYFVFRQLEIDDGEFEAIVRSNNDFAATILRRLNECAVKLNDVAYFSKEDILFAQNRIAELRKAIEKVQAQASKRV
jgi:hypothetical protein